MPASIAAPCARRSRPPVPSCSTRVRGRGAAASRGGNSLIRLEAADQIFGALIALSDLAEHGTPWNTAPRRGCCAGCGRCCEMLGRASPGRGRRTQPADRPLDRRHGRRGRSAARLRPAAPARAAHHRAPAHRPYPGAAAELPARRRSRPVGPRHGGSGRCGRCAPTSTWRSAALRHAVRIAVVATPALAFTMVMSTSSITG